MSRAVIRQLLAFVRRDLLAATSYKTGFATRVATLGSSILTVYFLSRMIEGGSVAAMDAYGGRYFAFAIVGVAFADYLTASVTAFSRSLRRAQHIGTLEAMFATPVSPAVVVVGSALYTFGWSMLRIAIYIAAGIALGARFPEADLLGSAAAILLSIPAFAAVGILGAAFVLVVKQWEPITAVFTGLGWLLGGVLYPVASLPELLQPVALLLPITHALEAMRGALILGQGPVELAVPLGLLAAFCALVLPLAVWSLGVAVRRVRIEGSAAVY